ncbi:fic family toxin-antitoxin system, toxin component [Streptomyces celluloflavus]|uniref:fic family toxin-antitoxin system, toxin component n=1 Tax=Streptomyces celluloflavus TaxID=58344 RepID=UPI003693148F
MTVRIDLAWLLLIAEQHTPGDPQVTDWGALVAAVSRHEAEILGVPVYPDPQDRAAALLQLLLQVPALEGSNAMFATAVAYGYLVASGLKIATSPERVRDLAHLIRAGATDIHTIANELRTWTV